MLTTAEWNLKVGTFFFKVMTFVVRATQSNLKNTVSGSVTRWMMTHGMKP